MTFAIIVFCVALAGAGAAAIVLFLRKANEFKANMREVGTDLGSMTDLATFTAETATRLQEIFSRVPALALCYQGFYQSLIPPQPPFESYYRSGRPAAELFDRQFILKNSLQLRFFNAVPGVLVSVGVLGTIVGFAAAVSHARPMLAGDARDAAGVLSMIFSTGAAAFWPMAVGIVFAVAVQILERFTTHECGDMIEVVTVSLDTQMPAQTVEQITATSLTELRQQHQTILNFTGSYFTTLRGTVMGLISNRGTLTVEDLVKEALAHSTRPIEEQLMALRRETNENFGTMRTEFAETMHNMQKSLGDTRAAIVNIIARAQQEVGLTVSQGVDSMVQGFERVHSDLRKVHSGVENVSGHVISVRDLLTTELLGMNERLKLGTDILEQAGRELLGAHTTLRTEGIAQLEALRAEIKDQVFRLANEPQGDQSGLLERMAQTVSHASELLVGELERMKAQLANEMAGLDMHALHANVARIADNSDLSIELLHAQKNASVEVHDQLVASTEIITNDLHAHQNALTGEMDRHTQTLTRTLTALGVDVAGRMNAVSQILVGENIDMPPAEFGAMGELSREELDEKITQWSERRRSRNVHLRAHIEERLGQMQEQLGAHAHEAQEQLLREVREGRYHVETELEARNAQLQRELRDKHDSLRADADWMRQQTQAFEDAMHAQAAQNAQAAQTMAQTVAQTVAQQVAHQAEQVAHASARMDARSKEVTHKVTEEVNALMHELTARIEDIHHDLTARVEQITHSFDERINKLNRVVAHDLDKMGDSIEDVARDFADLSQDIGAVRDFLTDMPLSRIEVINSPLRLRERKKDTSHRRSADPFDDRPVRRRATRRVRGRRDAS